MITHFCFACFFALWSHFQNHSKNWVYEYNTHTPNFMKNFDFMVLQIFLSNPTIPAGIQHLFSTHILTVAEMTDLRKITRYMCNRYICDGSAFFNPCAYTHPGKLLNYGSFHRGGRQKQQELMTVITNHHSLNTHQPPLNALKH